MAQLGSTGWAWAWAGRKPAGCGSCSARVGEFDSPARKRKGGRTSAALSEASEPRLAKDLAWRAPPGAALSLGRRHFRSGVSHGTRCPGVVWGSRAPGRNRRCLRFERTRRRWGGLRGRQRNDRQLVAAHLAAHPKKQDQGCADEARRRRKDERRRPP